MNDESPCNLCGGIGILPNGGTCKCKQGRVLSVNTEYISIPKQYLDITFNKNLIQTDIGNDYSDYLYELYQSVINKEIAHKNIYLSSPPNHSKTLFAFSCIKTLFSRGEDVFPLYDLLEIRRIVDDFDVGRTQKYNEYPELIFKCNILILLTGNTRNTNVYSTLINLINRRVRQGGSTIILSNFNWETFIQYDNSKALKSMEGKGDYNTIIIKNWVKESD